MTPDWSALAARFPPRAVAYLRELYERPGSFSVSADELAKEADIATDDAARMLDALAGFLTRVESLRCAACGETLEDDTADECPNCGAAFVDKPPVRIVRYQLEREPPRDVPWVLVLHGMNTRGTWQEELSWLISRSYRRMVPVAIYKYGIIRPGVLFRWRQRQLVRGLIAKIRKLSGDAAGSGYGARPDVIAHSFGTWMIAHALSTDEGLAIGRLILLGCIVRPDFDWNGLIASGRVSAILNHGASNDRWVPIAEFAIPDSGPGALRGFPSPVSNVVSPGLGHSDYFAPDSRMRDLFETTWRPFLSWTTVPPLPNQTAPSAWKPLSAAVRLMTRTMAMTLFWLLIVFAALIVLLGVDALPQWIASLMR